jgi:pimeloyl-ACP methyl ester carboxylesterase
LFSSIALAAVIAALLLFLSGIAYQSWQTRKDLRRIPMPGRLVEVSSRKLHIYEVGQGSPAVVLEAGLAASSLSWALIQAPLAQSTKVVSYDRAGFGWSEMSPEPLTIRRAVDDLGLLLEAAGVTPPYILGGHSFGGLLVRAFAHLRPHEVVGIVLVDPVSLDFWADCDQGNRARLRLGTKLSRRGALLAELGIVRLALSALTGGQRWLPKLIARGSAGRATNLIGRLVEEVKKLPPALWPAIRAHWSRPKCFRSMAATLQILPQAAAEVRDMPIAAEVPVTVISAGNATESELMERDRWANQSRHGKHAKVVDCGHWIQLEKPELVVAAFCEILRKVHGNGVE